MTQHQPEQEQNRYYRYRATASVSRRLVRRGEASQRQAIARQQASTPPPAAPAADTRKAVAEQRALARVITPSASRRGVPTRILAVDNGQASAEQRALASPGVSMLRRRTPAPLPLADMRNVDEEQRSLAEPARRKTPTPLPLVDARKAESEQNAVATATSRRVTMPHKAIQPLPWAERNERRYRALPSEPMDKHPLVQRTLSQTGRPAPAGSRHVSKPLPRRSAGSPVPARKRRRKGRGFWGKFFGFLSVLLVIVGGVIFALTSSTFTIQQVTISGTHNATLLASIGHIGIRGQNIFLFNQSAVTARLNALPLVASANLIVQLPNSVFISVEERVPVLLWQSGQTTFGVASDGTVIAPINELEQTNGLHTVIDRRTDAQVHAGTRFNAADLLFVQQLYQRLPLIGVETFTLEYVDQIIENGRSEPANEGHGGSYTLVSTQGWVAYLGDETNSNSLQNRLLELQAILNLASQQHLNLATIDLRFGLRPIYTLKS